jgi:hypothetical protein
MWKLLVLAFAACEPESPSTHGEEATSHIAASEHGHATKANLSGVLPEEEEAPILAEFRTFPEYCDYAAWEVEDCVGHPTNYSALNHVRVRMNAIVTLIWIIVLISIGFEGMSTSAHKYAVSQGRFALTVFRSLSQEILSVGLIVLVSTVLIQTGNMRLISDMLFQRDTGGISYETGELMQGYPEWELPHDIRFGHQISELTVMFQDIHFFISCVVVSLACMGTLGLWVEDRGLKAWREAEDLVAELGSDVDAYIFLLNKIPDTPLVKRSVLHKKLAYLSFRSEFLTPLEGVPPPHVHPDRFDFLLYCRENMGEKIVSCFQGPKYVYIIFYACSLMLMPFFGMTAHAHVRFFVVTPYLLLFAYAALWWKLLWIEDQLKPTEKCMRAKANGIKFLVKMAAKYRSRGLSDSSTSAHDGLFWFGHGGPAFLIGALQFLSMTVGIYLATLFHSVLDTPYTWLSYGPHAIPVIIAPLFIIIYVLYGECLYLLVFCTSCEELSNHKVIRMVNAEADSMKTQYWKVVIASIKREVISHMIHEAVRSQTLADLAIRFEHFSEGQKAYYLHCFEAYNISGQGGLNCSELVKCLTEILPSDANTPVRKRASVAATTDDQSEQAQNEIEQITSDAEEWFRIFGIQSDGSLGLEAFQALVVCITQSSHGMLSEQDILPVLIRHAGMDKSEDTSCGSKELETLMHSITEVKPFKHAGTIILEEIRRSEGTTLKREGKGWKSVVHQMKKELPVSLKAVAKYVVRLDVQAQAATGRLRRASQYEKRKLQRVNSARIGTTSSTSSPVKEV